VQNEEKKNLSLTWKRRARCSAVSTAHGQEQLKPQKEEHSVIITAREGIVLRKEGKVKIAQIPLLVDLLYLV